MGGKDVLGICLELIATFMSASGYTCQKLAHMQVAAGRTEKPYYKLPKFLIGLLLLVLGSVIAVAVFGLLDQSKQAPMAACTLIYNSILSAKFLGEKFTRVDFFSSALMAGGTVMAVFFSAKNSTKFTFTEITDRLNDSVVFLYAIFIVACLIGAAVYTEVYNKIPRATWSRRAARLVCFCDAFLAGFLAGFTAYFSKAFITIFYTADWKQFKNPVLYIYIACLAGSLFNQLRYLNRGLRDFDSLQMIPMYQSFIVFSGMMSGIVFYGDMREPELAPTRRFIGFGSGGMLTISGILLLLWKKKASADMPDRLPLPPGKPLPDDDHRELTTEVSLPFIGSTSDSDTQGLVGSGPAAAPDAWRSLTDGPSEDSSRRSGSGSGSGSGTGAGAGAVPPPPLPVASNGDVSQQPLSRECSNTSTSSRDRASSKQAGLLDGLPEVQHRADVETAGEYTSPVI